MPNHAIRPSNSRLNPSGDKRSESSVDRLHGLSRYVFAKHVLGLKKQKDVLSDILFPPRNQSFREIGNDMIVYAQPYTPSLCASPNSPPLQVEKTSWV